MPDALRFSNDLQDDPIDSEWEYLRRRSGNDEQHQSFPTPPGFPDAALRPEVERVLGQLRQGMAVGSVQRRLIELAQAFSVRPEDVPEGLLLRRERLTLHWIAMSPYHPMSSPREAIELIRTATWLASKPSREERAARAEHLWSVLEPSLR